MRQYAPHVQLPLSLSIPSMEVVMLAQQERLALVVHTSYLLPKAGTQTHTPPTLCSAPMQRHAKATAPSYSAAKR